jgi:hypothetical protein
MYILKRQSEPPYRDKILRGKRKKTIGSLNEKGKNKKEKDCFRDESG